VQAIFIHAIYDVQTGDPHSVGAASCCAVNVSFGGLPTAFAVPEHSTAERGWVVELVVVTVDIEVPRDRVPDANRDGGRPA
jgi:hypothetical protein